VSSASARYGLHDFTCIQGAARRTGGSAHCAAGALQEFLYRRTGAAVAHYIIGSARPAADLRTTAIFGLWSLLPYAIYLAVIAWGAGKLPLPAILLLAMLAWGVAATLLIMLWVRFQPS
jgi:uncharacterized membrane protein (GlpM family)